MLAYIYYNDGTNFNQELIEQGNARRYDDSSFTLKSEFGSIEEEAQSENRGLWEFDGEATPTTTSSDGGDVVIPTPSNDPYDCGDFDSQEQAQAVLEGTPGDPSGLDSDSDGTACKPL